MGINMLIEFNTLVRMQESSTFSIRFIEDSTFAMSYSLLTFAAYNERYVIVKHFPVHILKLISLRLLTSHY